jgi:competence protein ComEC
LVVAVRVGGLGILVPGDAEARTLSRLALSDVDCIVVPHHGSRDAVSASLLRDLSPEVAVVSAGRDNSFGHPNPETISVMGEAGVQVFRTDVSGWVALRATGDDGSAFTVSIGTDANHERVTAGRFGG